MKHQTRLATTLEPASVLIFLLLIAQFTLVHSNNGFTFEMPEDDDMNRFFEEAETSVSVLLGAVCFGMLFVTISCLRTCCFEETDPKLFPFHNLILRELQISSDWMLELHETQRGIFPNFINHLPIFRRQPVHDDLRTSRPRPGLCITDTHPASEWQGEPEPAAGIEEAESPTGFTGQRAYETDVELSHALITPPQSSPDTSEHAFRLIALKDLILQPNWHKSREARVLAKLIAKHMKDSHLLRIQPRARLHDFPLALSSQGLKLGQWILSATLSMVCIQRLMIALSRSSCCRRHGLRHFRRFQSTISLAWSSRRFFMNVHHFDLSYLEASKKGTLERAIVVSLREKVKIDNHPLASFRTHALDDRIRGYYRSASIFSCLDHHAISSQANDHLYQIPSFEKLQNADVPEWAPCQVEDLLIRDQSPIILQAAVGMGKTAWCHWMTKQWSSPDADVGTRLTEYPYLLLVPLGDWLSRFREISNETGEHQDQRIRYWLTRGLWLYGLGGFDSDRVYPPLKDVLLVLDGYDEVVHARPHRAFRRALQQLLMPNNPFQARKVIMTTRPHVWPIHDVPALARPSHEFHVYRISAMGSEQQTNYITSYFSHRKLDIIEGVPGILLKDSFRMRLKRHPELKDLCGNPLMLNILCWHHCKELGWFTRRDRSFIRQAHSRLTPTYRLIISSLKWRLSRRPGAVGLTPAHTDLLCALANLDGTNLSSHDVMAVLRRQGIVGQKAQRETLDHLSIGFGLLMPTRCQPNPRSCDWQFTSTNLRRYYQALGVSRGLCERHSGALTPTTHRLLRERNPLLLLLVGTLASIRDTRALSVLRSTVNKIVDFYMNADLRAELTHIVCMALGEISLEQQLTIPLRPALTRTLSFPSIVEVTASAGLCRWFKCQSGRGGARLDMQQANADGITALHLAAHHGDSSVFYWFLSEVSKEEQTSFLRKQDRQRKTPLHIAAEHGDLSFCEHILNALAANHRRSDVQEAAAALIRIKDAAGQTALHIAAQNVSVQGDPHACIYDLLLARSGNNSELLDLRNNDNQTAEMLLDDRITTSTAHPA